MCSRSVWRRWWRQHRKRRIDTSIVCYRLVCGSKHNSAAEVLKSKLYLLYVLINKACICVRFQDVPLSLTLGRCTVCILLEYLFDDIIVLLDPHWSRCSYIYKRYACVRPCVCLLCLCALVCSFSFSYILLCVCVCVSFVCLFVYYSMHVLCI